jgi:hypothetical protein
MQKEERRLKAINRFWVGKQSDNGLRRVAKEVPARAPQAQVLFAQCVAPVSEGICYRLSHSLLKMVRVNACDLHKEIIMALAQLIPWLAWCTGIGYLILLLWFSVFTLAHGWLYTLHGRWFNIPEPYFDTIHYLGMAIYKIGMLLFFLVPLLALCIMS